MYEDWNNELWSSSLLGTQNRLKSKFGTGYQLAFNCAPGRVSDVEQFVRNNLRKAVHIETYAGTSRVHVASSPDHINFAIAKLAKVRVSLLMK